MAAVAAITAQQRGIALRCQLLLYPLTDARPDTGVHPSRGRNAEIPPLTRSAVQFFNRLLLPDMRLADHWHISVLLAPDVAGVAPALVVLADRDILHDEDCNTPSACAPPAWKSPSAPVSA